ncbi:lipopolysaccharide core biosynthesis protein [Pseudomonas sp. BGr12]|uniref:lipopolysaccharide core biosynthesis protein n=1 Tax=unclassified Pseudomonas TaxID=196821 RepID=UPI001CE22C95|nr:MULTISPECIES: lipopolysaccharide core biosynthesis protein [unclassified Pseudomonas]MDL2427136.1 lipopolysaccharide core biosynthesis protein [Pseudomonas sp. BJa5]
MTAVALEVTSSGERGLRLPDGQYRPLSAWEPLRNSCSGPVFIIASGPSVAEFPMQRYDSVPMIAMNGSIACFEAAGLRPLFYLCDDAGVAEKKSAALASGIRLARWSALNLESMQRLYEKEPQSLEADSLLLMERVNRWIGVRRRSDRSFAWSARRDPDFVMRWSLLSQTANRIGFSRNYARGYFNARTIAYAAVQLAYFLGFDKVFLVGVDMNSALGQFYDPAGAQVKSRLDGDFGDHILPHFDILARRVIDPGFQVFNLSRDSRLPAEMIPKVSLEQVDDLIGSAVSQPLAPEVGKSV